MTISILIFLMFVLLFVGGVLILRKNRTKAILMISLPLLFILTVWLYAGSNLNKVTIQRSLSEAQIKEFSKEKNLKPLAIRNIKDAFTVILYETETKMGYYALATDDSGKISTCGAAADNNADTAPVSVQGVATGIPFAAIIINEQNIINNSHSITVKFADGYEATELVNQRKGIIFPNEPIKNSNVGIEAVHVNDKDGKLLFEL